MNISNLLDTIKSIASGVKTVRSAYDGDVYTIWNTGEIKYASFVVGVTSINRLDNSRQYNLILYYGDRLLNNGRNKNAIWDDAANTLQTVINKLQSSLDEVVGEYDIQLFEQKFEDMLAGGYVNLSIEVEDGLGECEMNDVILPEDELIEHLKEAIREYREKDAQLSELLKKILFKVSGEVVGGAK